MTLSWFDLGSTLVRPQKPWTSPFYGSMNGPDLKTLFGARIKGVTKSYVKTILGRESLRIQCDAIKLYCIWLVLWKLYLKSQDTYWYCCVDTKELMMNLILKLRWETLLSYEKGRIERGALHDSPNSTMIKNYMP